ncbi:MAG: site-specific DNA-methyltransferase [Armatimonadota bacterium]|nr:MAG: site-specific DNA-methyltransferase [Armatimonadota bacterium]
MTERKRRSTTARPRANRLDGKTWTRNSISVWSDLRKTPEELRLKHPALFPAALASRIIECFAAPGDKVVLDPFAGLGSTIIAAAQAGLEGVGVELNRDFADVALQRLAAVVGEDGPAPLLHVADARKLPQYVEPESVDLVITSPPYWDILTRRRSADRKAIRNYGKAAADIGRITAYEDFLDALQEVFAQVFAALRPGKYCVPIVMDLRKHGRFYPFHADLSERLESIGFIYDDMIIWDRRQEYNNLRPLGYPSVFRVNKVHEFVLIFRKPAAQRAAD